MEVSARESNFVPAARWGTFPGMDLGLASVYTHHSLYDTPRGCEKA